MDNRENKEVKSSNAKNNNTAYIIIAVGIVILIVGGFLLIKGCSSKKDNNENNENTEEIKKEAATEESIINAYGMSKEDAINLVKEIYNGDNYEFSADINEDSKYIVTVKNTLTETNSKFLVDPTSTSKSYYEINE